MMKIFVYRNLNRRDYFSIQLRQGKRYGRRLGLVRAAVMHDVSFPVQQKAREKVLKTGRRTVHAGVLGQLDFFLIDRGLPRPRGWRRATYNPYRYKTFVDVRTGRPVIYAREVILTDEKVYYH